MRTIREQARCVAELEEINSYEVGVRHPSQEIKKLLRGVNRDVQVPHGLRKRLTALRTAETDRRVRAADEWLCVGTWVDSCERAIVDGARRRAAKGFAQAWGMNPHMAGLMLGSRVDFHAMRIATEVMAEIFGPRGYDAEGAFSHGGWDSTGDKGVPPALVDRVWLACGCNKQRFRARFKTLVSFLWKYRRDYTTRAGNWRPCIRFPKRVAIWRCERKFHAWLNGYRETYFLRGFRISDKALVRLGSINRQHSRRLCQLGTALNRYFPGVAYMLPVYRVRDMAALVKRGSLPRRFWQVVGATPLELDEMVRLERATVCPSRRELPALRVAIHNLVRLFSTAAGAERYARKHFGSAEHALAYRGIHDAGQFSLPEGKLQLRHEWASKAMRFGPEWTRLVKFASAVEEKFGGVPSSLAKLREQVAEFAYEGVSPGQKALATAAFARNLTESEFQDYVELCEQKKVAESLPYVKVSGSEVGEPDAWEFEKLDAFDPVGPMLGHDTDCCQHLHGAGSDCARKGWTSPFCGFYAVRYKGRIVAQSYAWRGTRGEVVFDNVECLGGTYDAPVAKLYKEASSRLLGRLGVSAVLVGTGYDGLTALTYDLKKVKKRAVSIEPLEYSDAHDQRVIARISGICTL